MGEQKAKGDSQITNIQRMRKRNRVSDCEPAGSDLKPEHRLSNSKSAFTPMVNAVLGIGLREPYAQA